MKSNPRSQNVFFFGSFHTQEYQLWVQKIFKNPRMPRVERGLPTNTHVSKMWVSNVGILPENKTHVLKRGFWTV